MITIRELSNKVQGVRMSGDGFYAKCPAHDDSQASLSVQMGTRGIVMKCHAGCTLEALCMAMSISAEELFADHRERTSEAKKGASPKTVAAAIAATIDYELRGISGAVEAVHRRIEYEDGTKTFHWVTATGQSGLGGKKAADLPLYLTHLMPTYNREEPVFVVEGEKKAHALLELGLQVVATSCGANNQPTKEVLAVLRGYRVVLWPDNDDVGVQHMQRVSHVLTNINTVYGMIDPVRTGLGPKQDCADLVESLRTAGANDETIIKRIDEMAMSAGTMQVAPKACRLEEIVAQTPKQRMQLIGPIRERDLVEIYAMRGIGKTHFGLSMAYALAAGHEFMHWKCPTKRRVLYIDGEMQITDIVDRMKLYKKTFGVDPGEHLSILSNDLIDGYIPSLSTPEGQRLVDDEIFYTRTLPYEVVFMDNVSTLFGGQENDSEAWESAHRWLLSLRKKGVCVVFMHHAGKGGQQRGTSRREDILDVVIKLAAHDPRQSLTTKSMQENWGACFEVLFEKSRGVYGELVKPFMCGLHENVWKSFELEER